jgi:GT2 family glycosyltransferase
MNLRRITRRLPHAVRDPLLRVARRSTVLRRMLGMADLVRDRYPAWLSSDEARLIAAIPSPVELGAASGAPRISIVMPVYETPVDFLREVVASVQAQTWPHWELCIADDASPSIHLQGVLSALAAGDSRIRVTRRATNGHISAASNTALELATGEWVALLDHDDILPPHALASIVATIRSHPDAAVLFSDEDKIDDAGSRFDPYFKPGFDPDLLLGQNLISHLGVYRRDLLLRIGGWRIGFEGSQDYDLALRAIAAAGDAAVVHVPGVLYHWRSLPAQSSFSQASLDRCLDAARRALGEYLATRGVVGACVEAAPGISLFHRVRWPLPATPARVALVLMPGADHAASIEAARGLLTATSHPIAEVLVALAAETVPSSAGAELGIPVRLLPCGVGAGWARRINRAAAASQAEIIVVLGDCPTAVQGDWLDEVASQLARPEIGAVGSLVLDGSGRVRHAEVALDRVGIPRLAYAGAPRDTVGQHGALALARRVGALSGNHLGIRRALFLEAGGADEMELDGGLADVDLCLRLRARGLAVLWTPHAATVELGAAQPIAATTGHEADLLARRWGDALLQDPARSPLLGLEGGKPALQPTTIAARQN